MDGHRHRGNNAQRVVVFHDRGQCELRPALRHVCSTAAVVGLQSEQIRFLSVCAEHTCGNIGCAGDLIDLLVILMRPHIGGNRCRECIERKTFEDITPIGIARDRHQPFVGIHRLADTAQLRALDRCFAGKTLVTREVAVCHAMVLHQRFIHMTGIAVGDFAAEPLLPQRFCLDGHRQIDHVRIPLPLAFGCFVLFKFLIDELFVILALIVEQITVIENPFLLRAVVKPIRRNQTLKPAVLSPAEQGMRGKMPDCLSDRAGNSYFDLIGIRRLTVGIHNEHLGEQQQRPHIVACALALGTRADPAVLALTCKDGIDVLLCACNAVLIPQKVRQRHKAVQPVRNALPPLAASADPAGIADIGPDFVKVAGESVGFGFELVV